MFAWSRAAVPLARLGISATRPHLGRVRPRRRPAPGPATTLRWAATSAASHSGADPNEDDDFMGYDEEVRQHPAMVVPHEDRMRHGHLVQVIRLCNDAYYNGAEPLIDDPTYDDFFLQLQALETKWPMLASEDSPTRTVGAPPNPVTPTRVVVTDSDSDKESGDESGLSSGEENRTLARKKETLQQQRREAKLQKIQAMSDRLDRLAQRESARAEAVVTEFGTSSTPPSPPTSIVERLRVWHHRPMLSLRPANTPTLLHEALKPIFRVSPGDATLTAAAGGREEEEDVPMTVEWKYDGVALSAVYEQGKLQYVATRGDGFQGLDVSQAVKVRIPTLPRDLPYTRAPAPWSHELEQGTFVVRGEAMARRAEMTRVNQIRKSQGLQPYSAPRNLASGLLNRIYDDDLAAAAAPPPREEEGTEGGEEDTGFEAVTLPEGAEAEDWERLQPAAPGGGEGELHPGPVWERVLPRGASAPSTTYPPSPSPGAGGEGDEEAALRLLRQQQEGQLDFLPYDCFFPLAPPPVSSGTQLDRLPDAGAEKPLFSAQHEKYDLLTQLGFPSPPSFQTTSTRSGVDSLVTSFNQQRGTFLYDCDGVVFKVDSLAKQRALGEGHRYPHWAVAYKFPSESAVTQLRDVVLSVSRQRVATPVALLKPVRIGGRTISRVSLLNTAVLKRFGITRPGLLLEIAMRGDAIPQVVGVSSRMAEEQEAAAAATDGEGSEPAKHHFSCVDPATGEFVCPCEKGRPLRLSGLGLAHCEEEDCPEAELQALVYFGQTMGLGATAKPTHVSFRWQAAFDLGVIRTPEDMFTKWDELLNVPGWGELRVEKLRQAGEKARQGRNLADLLHALAGVGKKAAGQLALAYGGDWKPLVEASAEEMDARVSEVEEAGGKKGRKEPRKVFRDLYEWFHPGNANLSAQRARTLRVLDDLQVAKGPVRPR